MWLVPAAADGRALNGASARAVSGVGGSPRLRDEVGVFLPVSLAMRSRTDGLDWLERTWGSLAKRSRTGRLGVDAGRAAAYSFETSVGALEPPRGARGAAIGVSPRAGAATVAANATLFEDPASGDGVPTTRVTRAPSEAARTSSFGITFRSAAAISAADE